MIFNKIIFYEYIKMPAIAPHGPFHLEQQYPQVGTPEYGTSMIGGKKRRKRTNKKNGITKRKIRRSKGKRTKDCRCKVCKCKNCRCNKKNRKMRSKSRSRRKTLIGFRASLKRVL
jgi:hypothetical protein